MSESREQIIKEFKEAWDKAENINDDIEEAILDVIIGYYSLYPQCIRDFEEHRKEVYLKYHD